MTKRLLDEKTDALSQREEQQSQQALRSKEEIVFVSEEPRYSLDDLILPEHVKEQIHDVVNYAHNSEVVFNTWGLEKTHKYSKRMGINFYGEPGTGKTMAAHAVAKYLGRKILMVNYADIESKYVGETPKNIHKAFRAASESQSVIFFDEADAILSRRVANMSHATDVSVNQTRSVLLTLLNDYQDFVLFATNFIENFDPAFMRRIARHVHFLLPDLECRKQLWRRYIPESMPNDINIDKLAEDFEGISGSEMSTAVLNAAFKAARRKHKLVSHHDVDEAIKAILKSKQANKKEKVRDVVTEKRVVSKEYAKQQTEAVEDHETAPVSVSQGENTMSYLPKQAVDESCSKKEVVYDISPPAEKAEMSKTEVLDNA